MIQPDDTRSRPGDEVGDPDRLLVKDNDDTELLVLKDESGTFSLKLSEMTKEART